MFTTPVIMGFMRHILTAAGGALVAGGYIESADLGMAVGAIMTLVGVVWSVVNKKQAA